MPIAAGTVVEGKVTGLTRYGAFVTLPDGSVGMVHISEVSHQFVNEISEFLEPGQVVKVMVLSADDNGKISLSVKKAAPVPKPRPQTFAKKPKIPPEEMTFEDKLKSFMQDSNNRAADYKRYINKKQGIKKKR